MYKSSCFLNCGQFSVLMGSRFEKSLYDLIRGLRHHKGNEREYIQNSLRECRGEIRGSDMDLKATALLKIIYLEMFGHDMSWAAFNVLEVMSSPKYLQKRVGYLGAVQSFRPDTEVLMLATNLLKKDLTGASSSTIALPLLTLPHVITPSLSMSLLSDILPRLSHSNPTVRKKTVVTLYRLALSYPEALRAVWPKLKDILMNDDEDSSVVAAVVNVVCELGALRPRDFLPLAPRLFDLLVNGGNNWMAIKIIKLFATLTPVEPRLVKKLLPPLTNLIRTTPAMSLLYECINGIIQGGIIESADSIGEGDEIAAMCVDKLHGMLAIEGDPNLRYVSLLAFNRIVKSHPYLVIGHQDVIMDCIDDADISTRLQALELGSGMINADNLISVVDRLVGQLEIAPRERQELSSHQAYTVQPAADSDNEDPEAMLRADNTDGEDVPAMPNEYRGIIIRRILDMCSKDTYANVQDFEWYIQILMRLIRVLPPPDASATKSGALPMATNVRGTATAVGMELRNVAIRVTSLRPEVVRSVSLLVSPEARRRHFPDSDSRAVGVLAFAVWIVGEYASLLDDPEQMLNSVLFEPLQNMQPLVVCAYLQAIPKLLTRVIIAEDLAWNKQKTISMSLLLTRILHTLEPLTKSPDLDVQERAVEFCELLKLATEAVSSHAHDSITAPPLLTDVFPRLYTGQELNPVAPSAQLKVPIPDGLDLSAVLNEDLPFILEETKRIESEETGDTDIYSFYHSPQIRDHYGHSSIESTQPAAARLGERDRSKGGQARESSNRTQRSVYERDDPYYITDIAANEKLGTSTQSTMDKIIRQSVGDEVDIDSIPIMELNIENAPGIQTNRGRRSPRPAVQVQIMADETIEGDTSTSTATSRLKTSKQGQSEHSERDKSSRRGLLQVDSSAIGRLSLDDGSGRPPAPPEASVYEDEAMAAELKRIEQLRLEMQRDSERIEIAHDIPLEGTVVKKRKKKKTNTASNGAAGEGSEGAAERVVMRKKKKKRKPLETELEH